MTQEWKQVTVLQPYSLRQLPWGMRGNHVTSPVVPEYLDSLGQLLQGVRAKHVTSPVVPEYSDSLGQLP